MGRVALTNRGIGEVGGRHGVDDHFGGGTVGLATHSDGAGVDASHGHGAVRAGGVLLVRAEGGRTGPAV